MSNPARPPKQPTGTQLALASSPDSFLPEGFQERAVQLRALEAAQALLAPLDMELASAFYVPRELTASAAVISSSRPTFALAAKGKPQARVRSALAKEVANEVWGHLPPEWRSRVGAKMEGTVYVQGGTEGTLERLAQAYPKRGQVPASPITVAEAAAAKVRCGVSLAHLAPDVLRPYTLLPALGSQEVSVNPHSENGFPVLEYWTTPGAAQKCYQLASQIRKEMEREGVLDWKLRAEAERPWLVAVKGKAKADYYSQEKVVGARMRFYNVLPRQIVLNMQVATQVLEHHARSILDDSRIHSGIGVSLVRGGADELVRALDEQLAREGCAYVHVGDDSWVIMRDGAGVVMFALDCSNFDLTQHAVVTQAVKFALVEELRRVDMVAAELWQRYNDSRLVVVSGSLVRRFKHGGPSGMPLQSKVNDLLMDVMIDRVVRRLRGRALSEGKVGEAVHGVARDMGFVAKLEQFSQVAAPTIREALKLRSFLFIGYYFHTLSTEQVAVHCDLPRTMAQLPFPGQKWIATQDVLPREAMRLGSISMNLGIPPRELEAAFAAFRDKAAALVERALAECGDVQDPKLRWAVAENPHAAEVQPSLSGLLRAMRRGPEQLWLAPADELPSTRTLVYPAMQQVAPLFLRRPAEPTHPPTPANDGRPPPTAVWGPDKPPQQRELLERAGPSRRRKRDRGAAPAWAQHFEWSSEPEDDDSTEDFY